MMSQIWPEIISENIAQQAKRKMQRLKRNAVGGKRKSCNVSMVLLLFQPGIVAKCPPICRIIPVTDRRVALFLF